MVLTPNPRPTAMGVVRPVRGNGKGCIEQSLRFTWHFQCKGVTCMISKHHLWYNLNATLFLSFTSPLIWRSTFPLFLDENTVRSYDPSAGLEAKSPNSEIIRHVQGETSLLPSQTSGRWHDVPQGVACGERQEEGVRRDKEVPPWPTASALLAGRWTLKATSSRTGAFLDPLEVILLACLATIPQHGPWILLLWALLPMTHGPVQCPHRHPQVIPHSLLTFSRSSMAWGQPISDLQEVLMLPSSHKSPGVQATHLPAAPGPLHLSWGESGPPTPSQLFPIKLSERSPGSHLSLGDLRGQEIHIMKTVLTQENPPETNTTL